MSMRQEVGRVVVIGGTGKTGRRVVERLEQLGIPVTPVSRSSEPRFDWTDCDSYGPALRGARAAYITYQPDLAVPGSVDAVRALVETALENDVRRLVLLSGRGEEEAAAAERVLQQSGADWTILQATWFAQNFSESFLVEAINGGEVMLPAGDLPEPFVDADDIADAAVAALTDERHVGRVYELTGPRLMTFAQATAEIAEVSGRRIVYRQVPADEYVSGLRGQGVPENVIWLLNYLFTTVFDGRNARLTDGVRTALGREPRDFTDYVRTTAATGVWGQGDESGLRRLPPPRLMSARSQRARSMGTTQRLAGG